MINMRYNPFGEKTIQELEASDLVVLRAVREGWYVEYKSETVSTQSIAKSLAAFANHYGGWVFYGVKGRRDSGAESFPGVADGDLSAFIQNIRNAAKDAVNPPPYYEHVILNGPCTAIDLPADRSVVALAVPSGPDTPYVHANGRIYRRIADASDPRAETDRLALDQLWQRGQAARSKLAEFLDQEPILSKGEDEVCFIQHRVFAFLARTSIQCLAAMSDAR